MAFGMGIGKPRTRLGKYLDTIGLTQSWLGLHTGISETTLTRLCNNREYRPNEKMKIRIVMVLQNEVDPHVTASDFW